MYKLIVTALVMGCCASGNANEPSVAAGLVVGNDVFVQYAEGEYKVGSQIRSFEHLYRLSTPVFVGSPQGVMHYAAFTASRGRLARISLVDDKLYFVCPGEDHFGYVPLESLQVFENSSLGLRLREKLGNGKPWSNAWSLNFQKPLYPLLFSDLGAQMQLWQEFDKHLSSSGIPRQATTLVQVQQAARIAIIPQDARWIRVFRPEKKTLSMRLVDSEHKREPSKDNAFVESKESAAKWSKEERSVESPFGEIDIAAFAVRDHYYFQTDDGRLYALPVDPAKNKMTPVWTDRKRVILGCIQDPDTKTVYAVGYGANDPAERFWFELAPEPKLHSFKRTAESLKEAPRRNEMIDAWKQIQKTTGRDRTQSTEKSKETPQ